MSDIGPQTTTSAPQPDDRRRLEEVRDKIAEKIAAGPGAADLATLSREYRLVLAALRELPATGAASGLDEITRKRQEREAAEAAARAAAGNG